MKHFILFLFVGCTICFSQNGSQKKFSVEIMNAKGQPIAFAEVLNKTDNFVFITDLNGVAEIKLNSTPALLEITATGYQTQRLQIDDTTIENLLWIYPYQDTPFV